MFRSIKQVLIALLSFSGSLAAKCMFLNDEPCLARPTVIDLNPNELHYYPFMVSLDRFNGTCNILDDPDGRICVLNKTGDVNLNVFNMTASINEAKTLGKHFT